MAAARGTVLPVNMLAERLRDAGAVGWEPVPPAAAAVLRRLTSSLVRELPSGSALPREAQRLDDLDAEHVRLALSVHAERMGEGVVAMLLANRQSAVTIGWDDLLLHFNDLWFPSADDLLVIGSDGHYVFVSHEEWSVGGRLEGG